MRLPKLGMSMLAALTLATGCQIAAGPSSPAARPTETPRPVPTRGPDPVLRDVLQQAKQQAFAVDYDSQIGVGGAANPLAKVKVQSKPPMRRFDLNRDGAKVIVFQSGDTWQQCTSVTQCTPQPAERALDRNPALWLLGAAIEQPDAFPGAYIGEREVLNGQKARCFDLDLSQKTVGPLKTATLCFNDTAIPVVIQASSGIGETWLAATAINQSPASADFPAS